MISGGQERGGEGVNVYTMCNHVWREGTNVGKNGSFLREYIC